MKNGQPTSELGLIRATMRLLKEHYGMTPACDFGPLKLKSLREVMIAKGWVRTEINRKVGRIRRMFKWGVENEMLLPSVLQALQAVTGLRKGRTQIGGTREQLPPQPILSIL